jgi:hypothetical protein
MATWTFGGPSIDEAPASWGDRLFIRVKLARGITVLEGPPGAYRLIRFPTQDEIAAASFAYMGGHDYDVDDSTKAALIAAGIGVTDANFSTAQVQTGPGFGSGGFGEGGFGG